MAPAESGWLSTSAGPPWRMAQHGPPSGLGALPEWLHLDADSLVAHAKANNPAVRQLASGLEQWHTSLRSEAQQRIGGFQPPLTLTSGILAEDWALLRGVGAPSPQPQLAYGMKRSASENSLETMGAAQGARKVGRQHAPWSGWEGSEYVVGGMWGSNPGHSAMHAQAHAHAHASAMQAMTSRQLLLTGPMHHPQNESDTDDSPHAAGFFRTGACATGKERSLNSLHHSHNSITPPGSWAGSNSNSPQQMSSSIPRVTTAPSSLTELGETLNYRANRNFQVGCWVLASYFAPDF